MATINQFIMINRLQPADVVVMRKKFFGMVDHFAVYLGPHPVTGRQLFAANYTKGTRYIDQGELVLFLQTLEPQRIERFIGTSVQRQQAINRALSKIGENNYNYFTNNCEHYKNFVQTGHAHSPQAEQFSKGIAVGAMFLLFGALLSE